MEDVLRVQFQTPPSIMIMPEEQPRPPIDLEIPKVETNQQNQDAGELTTDSLIGTEVHRFWDEQTQSHFFTASETEFSDRQNNTARYRYEGVEFNAPSSDAVGAFPVYRFENQQTGTFFYTLQEPDAITGQFPVLESDDIAFYAFSESTAPSSAVPIYRFYNESASTSTGTPVHFFTGTEENKDNVIQNVPGFTFEGPGWYAFGQGGGTSTLTNTSESDSLSILDNLDTSNGFDALGL